MNIFTRISPLRANVPIVDKAGRPLPAFVHLINKLFPNDKATSTAASAAQGTADDALSGLDAKADKTTQVIAGDGLTGGGDLSADRTFNVGAGTGISVAADAVSLADTAVTPGTYGDATHVSQITVDQQGRITSAADVAITGGSGTVTTTGTPASGNLAKFSGATSITNGDLSGDVTTSGTLVTTLANSGVSAATYGDATHVPQIAVDAKGRITSASNVAISGGSASLTLISEQTPSGTGTVTFSSIPGTYRSLRLIWVARTDNAATTDTMSITFNSDSGANYDRQLLSANGTSLTGGSAAAQTSAALANLSGNTAPAGASGSGEVIFPDYAGTTFQKWAISNFGYCVSTTSTGLLVRQLVLQWRSTSAITRIDITTAGNFVAGSKLQLYGVS